MSLHLFVAALVAAGVFILPARSIAVLDLDNISISITQLLPADTYRFQLDAEGSDLTDTSVTPPSGPPVNLPCAFVGSSADCTYVEDFGSLANLEAKFSSGSYLFVFNGASASISVTHRGFVDDPPLGSCDIDFDPKRGVDPQFGGGCTSSGPTFTWTCDSGCQTADELSVGLIDNTGQEGFDAAYFNPVGGSVTLPNGPFIPAPDDLEGQLGPLVEDTCQTYMLSCSVEDQLSTPKSIGADNFAYGDDTKVDEVINLPEPRQVLLLISGVVLLMGGGGGRGIEEPLRFGQRNSPPSET